MRIGEVKQGHSLKISKTKGRRSSHMKGQTDSELEVVPSGPSKA